MENTEQTVNQEQNAAQDVAQNAGASFDEALSSAVTDVIGGENAKTEDVVETSNVGEENVETKDAETKDVRVEQKDDANPYTSPAFAEQRALIERGIKAGMSIEDIMQIPTQAGAERLISQFEKANGIEQPKKVNEDVGAGSPADEYGDAIREMEDDGGYDPKILKLLKGMHGEITNLRMAGETARKGRDFNELVGKLDHGVVSKVDSNRMNQLRTKYDMLMAGYKATNAEVTPESVFQEAAQLALGDLMANAAEERKAEALNQRRNLTLARPGGENGQHHRGNGPVTEEDIASEIWDQIRSN